MHLSHGGTRLVVPTMDAQAFDVGPGKVDAHVREHRLHSYLRVFDTRTGEQVLCEKINARISYVQFSPIDRDVILYNNERPSDCGIWLWTGKEHRRLRDEGEGRCKDDWTCHEMWERDGMAIIYHGTYVDGRAYLGRVRSDGTGRVETPLPEGWRHYGHFTVGPSGWLATDGYYQRRGYRAPKAAARGFPCCASTGMRGRSTGIRSSAMVRRGSRRTRTLIPFSTMPALRSISPRTGTASARAIAWMSPMW